MLLSITVFKNLEKRSSNEELWTCKNWSCIIISIICQCGKFQHHWLPDQNAEHVRGKVESVQIGDAGLLQLRTTAVSQVIIPSTLAGFLHFNCSWPHTPSHEGCSQTINHTSISIQSNIHLNWTEHRNLNQRGRSSAVHHQHFGTACQNLVDQKYVEGVRDWRKACSKFTLFTAPRIPQTAHSTVLRWAKEIRSQTTTNFN